MEVIKNNKGGVKICLDGYMYTKKSTKASKIQWECSQKRSKQCKAVFFTSLDVSYLFSTYLLDQ